jgi:hypothetical protein
VARPCADLNRAGEARSNERDLRGLALIQRRMFAAP